jgi:hypothetical protein
MDPTVSYQKRSYTYADYLSWNNDVRRELIDGFVYVLTARTQLADYFRGRVGLLNEEMANAQSAIRQNWTTENMTTVRYLKKTGKVSVHILNGLKIDLEELFEK